MRALILFIEIHDMTSNRKKLRIKTRNQVQISLLLIILTWSILFISSNILARNLNFFKGYESNFLLKALTNNLPSQEAFGNYGRSRIVLGLDTLPFTKPSDDDITLPIKKTAVDDKIFTAVEYPATYPGGIDALTKDLYRNVKYPTEARSNHIEGKVFVNFVVEKDGSITNIKVIRGKELGGGLAEAAVEAVSQLKRFLPGSQNGKPIRQFFSMPVTFNLDNGRGTSQESSYSGEIFTSVDQQAEYPGGIEVLMQDLMKNVRYPKEAYDNNIQGRVYVQFVVEKDGLISNIKVIKGNELGGGLQEAAIKAVSKLKRFSPALQSGIPVRQYFSLPVSFQLDNLVQPSTYTKLDGDTVYIKPDVSASYPGGTENFNKDLFPFLKYPPEAYAKKIEGNIIVQFVVQKDGSITNIKAIKGDELGGGLSEAAIEAFKHLKMFVPAQERGQVVRQLFYFPITFDTKNK